MASGRRMNILLSSAEAARYLGVSRQTLYAYVSRGWVRSDAGDSSRSRRYNRLDLERLRQRKEVRSAPARKLTTALSWGVPLLETELTLIDEGQLYYRGRNAIELARSQQFFRVVQWFWNQDQSFQLPADGTGSMNPRPRSLPLREFQRCLLELSDRDVGGYDLSVPNVLSTGWRILELFLQCLVGRSSVRLEDAAQQLQQAWAPKNPDLPGILNAALILCMDHELNASSFTARVVASAESSLYEVVLAGLCALRGHRRGGMSLLCYQLLTELEATNMLRTTLVEWHREKGFVPGFGHPSTQQVMSALKRFCRCLRKPGLDSLKQSWLPRPFKCSENRRLLTWCWPHWLGRTVFRLARRSQFLLWAGSLVALDMRSSNTAKAD
jgi:citrate synthase